MRPRGRGSVPLRWPFIRRRGGERFQALAETCPNTETAEDCWVWIGSTLFYGNPAERAKEHLLKDFPDSQKLGPVFARLYYMPGSKATEALLRHEAEKSPHHDIRALATYWLAVWLKTEGNWATSARPCNGFFPTKCLRAGGRDLLERLKTFDVEALDKEADELLARVAKDYADVPSNDPRIGAKTLGEAAKERMAQVRPKLK